MNRHVESGEKRNRLATVSRIAERFARPLEDRPSLRLVGLEVRPERAPLLVVVREGKLTRSRLEDEVERVFLRDVERHAAMKRQRRRLLDPKAHHRDHVVEAIAHPPHFALGTGFEIERNDVNRLALTRAKVEGVLTEAHWLRVLVLRQVIDRDPHLKWK